MKIEAITQTKLYELAIQHKQHQEDIRDNINSYYISLFSAIVAVMPFINKVNESYTQHEFYIVKLSLLVLSFSWICAFNYVVVEFKTYIDLPTGNRQVSYYLRKGARRNFY